MIRVGFAFLTTRVMVSLTASFVAAPTLTRMPVPPVSSQILQFVADHIEDDAVALLRLVPSAQVKCRE